VHGVSIRVPWLIDLMTDMLALQGLLMNNEADPGLSRDYVCKNIIFALHTTMLRF
jgi:hypothetical protein